jgi:hypothetical protein
MENLDSINFNIFDYEEDNEALFNILEELFKNQHLLQEMDIDPKEFRSFLGELHNWYNCPAYHNFAHVVDVTQCLSLIIDELGVSEILTPLEQFALLISGIAHDMGHEGLNNDYLVQTDSHIVDSLGTDSPLEKLSVKILHRIFDDYRDTTFEKWTQDDFANVYKSSRSV